MSNTRQTQSQQIAALFQAWRGLQQQWAETKGSWNDPVQRRFEQRFWRQYVEMMHHSHQELPKIYATAKEIRRMCP